MVLTIRQRYKRNIYTDSMEFLNIFWLLGDIALHRLLQADIHRSFGAM